MKELSNLLRSKEVQEITQQQKIYKLDLDERITPHRGHTLFKVNLETGDVGEVKYSYDFVWCTKRAKFVPENPTLIKEIGYKYVSALNRDNVIKKLSKSENGSRIDHTKNKLKL